MEKFFSTILDNATLILLVISFIARIYYDVVSLTKRVEKLEEREDKHIIQWEKKWEQQNAKSEMQMDKIFNKFHELDLALKEIVSKNVNKNQ